MSVKSNMFWWNVSRGIKRMLLLLPLLIVFSSGYSQWTYSSQFGGPGTGNGQFGEVAAGIALDASGNIYVTDGGSTSGNNRVQKFNSAGSYLSKWGTQGALGAQFNGLRGIDIEDNGYIYVTDESNFRIQKFTPAGAYSNQVGGNGNGNGQFAWAYDVDVAPGANPAIWVVDRSNNRVQKFSSALAYQLQIAVGTSPTSLAIDGSGNIYVAVGGQIKKYNSSGSLITSWSTSGVYLATDASNNIYAAGGVNNTITLFNSTGTILAQKNFPLGTGNGEFTSMGPLAVDATGKIYICDGTRAQILNPAPVITVWNDSGGLLTSGSTHDLEFGDAAGEVARFSSDIQTFYVKNFGLATLNVSTISVSGIGDFSVSTNGLQVAPLSETSFTITFSPLAVGTRSTALSLTSNAPDQNGYSVNFNAVGIKAQQVFSIEQPFNPKVGTSIPITTSSNSGLAADNYALTAGAPNSITGSTLNCVQAGPITIRVREMDGNADYGPYTDYFDFNVAPGDQVISFDPLPNKTYGDAPFVVNASGGASGNPVTFSIVSGPATATGVNGSTITITGAGTVEVTASQLGNSNYNAATDVIRAFTVNPKPITVTANPGQSKAYGAVNPVLTYTVDPPLIAPDVFSGTLARTAGENAGTYSIIPGTLSAGPKYSITFVSNPFTITKATPSLDITSATSGIYGTIVYLTSNTSGSTGAVTYFVTNGAEGTSGSATLNGNQLSLTGAGEILLEASIAADANYNAASTGAPGSFTILKANPVIAITSATTVVYGTPVQLTANTGGSSGSVSFASTDNGTGSGSITGSNVFTPTYVGTYEIKLAVAEDANYNMAETTTFLTINPRVVTVTAQARSKVYGTVTDPELIYTVEPPLVEDDFFNGSLAREAGENAGDYTIYQGTLVLGDNYTITYTPANFTITPKPLSITGLSVTNKVYDGNTSATLVGTASLVVDGILPGDNVSLATNTAQAAFTDKNVGPNKVVSVSGYSLAGHSAVNYTLAQPDLTATITAKPITVIAETNQHKVYGADDPVLTFGVSPALISGDSFTGVLTRAQGENVGAYAIGMGTLSAGSNYSINYVGAEFTINKAAQTITFGALAAKTFGDANFTLSATASSTLAVTYSSSNTAVATISGSTVTIVGAGSTSIIANQAGNTNYNAAASVEQNLTINMANQTITFNPLPSKDFGHADFSLNATGGNSGNPITFQSTNTAVATISGSTVTIVGAGSTSIIANQAGSTNYNAAPPIERNFTVNKANQTITFEPIDTKTFGNAAFNLGATTTATGLAITYTATPAGRLTISNGQATITGAGLVTITATQAGNANYNAATEQTQTFCINPAAPVVTASFTNPEAPVLTSNAASGNQWYQGADAIAGATNATYTVSGTGGAGIYKVQSKVDDCISQFSNTVSIVITGDLSRQTEITAWPNPVSDYLTIEGVSEAAIAKMMSTEGREVSLPARQSGSKLILDMRNAAQGVYYVQVKDHSTVTRIRVIRD